MSMRRFLLFKCNLLRLTCMLASITGVLISHHVIAFAPTTTTTTILPNSIPIPIPIPIPSCSSDKFFPLWSSISPEDDNHNDERQRLLEMAKKLRDEARILEGEVRSRPKQEASASSPAAPTQRSAVTDLKDSTWTISYRFSSQPKDDDDNNDGGVVLPNYSGKVTMLLKANGYSEMVTTADNRLKITKIWGWDEEYSQEDQQQYLLFSMDVQLPKSDPKLPDATERYYFQARVDRTSNGGISLSDGTVTVKKDVAEKTKGMWGLFQVGGILSRFRYVGDFIGKPS